MDNAVSIAASVRSGGTDASEAVLAALAAIEELNPHLNAIVNYDRDMALNDVRLVKERLAAGEDLPLAGVPLIVKDNVWVAGRRIAQGSRLFDDFIAPADAICVARARRAGAVIVGIGNCPEFACKGHTNSPLHGAARHPANHALTPGGSSGGNAAALAAGFAALAIGTDGGGSGRRPPAHTGTVGFKPSFGAIPYGPGFPEPFWGIATIAPMARDVADTSLLFEVLAGEEPDAPEAIAIAPGTSVRPVKELRLAYSPRLGLDVPVDSDVETSIETAIEALAADGWSITRTDPVWPKGLSEQALMPIQLAGLAALHGETYAATPHLFDPDIARQIEAGLALPGTAVAVALEAGQNIRLAIARFLSEFDLLLCPTAPCVAWPVDQLGPTHIGGVAVAPRGHAVFTPFFNHALTPAISIPCGTGRDKLPVGLQIISRRGADRQVLSAAGEAEMILAANNRTEAH